MAKKAEMVINEDGTVEQINTEEQALVEEESKPSLWTRIKNSKAVKIAAGVGLVGLGVGGTLLGINLGKKEDSNTSSGSIEGLDVYHI